MIRCLEVLIHCSRILTGASRAVEDFRAFESLPVFLIQYKDIYIWREMPYCGIGLGRASIWVPHHRSRLLSTTSVLHAGESQRSAVALKGSFTASVIHFRCHCLYLGPPLHLNFFSPTSICVYFVSILLMSYSLMCSASHLCLLLLSSL